MPDLTHAPDGLLPDARLRLDHVVGALRCLQVETAWECAAARAYRASLETLIGDVERLRDDVSLVELDVRAAWRSAVLAGAW